MHHRFLSWLLFCAFFAVVPLRAQAPGGVPTVTGGAENIIAAKVLNTVTMTVNGVVSNLQTGMTVPKKAKINTANNASVVLAFSNGATTQLGSDTELIIEEYLQDPFAQTVRVAEATDEPSASTTKIALNRGELVGNVKKLNYGKGSSFTIQTPVGAAGIRGTTFRIVFRPTGAGQAFTFTLSTAVGNVAFNGSAPGTPAVQAQGTGTGLAIPQGQEIVMLVDVTTNAQGQLVVTSSPAVPTQTAAIAPTTMQQVTSTAQEIAVAVATVTFTPPPAGGGGTSSGNLGQNQGQGQGTNPNTTTVTGSNFEGTVQAPPAQTPPPAQVPAVRTTNP